MIALMNYAIPLILVLTVFLTYKFRKPWIFLAGIVVVLVYTIAQPTMLPKGTVASPRIEATQFVDKPIVDRSFKLMSDDERDAKRNATLKEINDSIENTIEKEKQ